MLTLTTSKGYVITVAPSFAIAPSKKTWNTKDKGGPLIFILIGD